MYNKDIDFKKYFTLNNLVQVCLIAFTILGFSLISLKIPEYGLIANLIAQFFWLYSGYKAWREAKQIGIFIVAIFITIIVILGIINYWLI